MRTTSEYSGATFSDCRKWRYVLWRRWDKNNPKMIAFIGLNPSTADETENDPTVRRRIGYAKRWDYGGMYMLNLFAFRATDPKKMKKVQDPVGKDNDRMIAVCAFKADKVVFCWGNHGAHRGRSQEIRKKIGPAECFGFTKAGEPKHPLYLRAGLETIPVKAKEN